MFSLSFIFCFVLAVAQALLSASRVDGFPISNGNQNEDQQYQQSRINHDSGAVTIPTHQLARRGYTVTLRNLEAFAPAGSDQGTYIFYVLGHGRSNRCAYRLDFLSI
jgi:hypothetical protein